MDSGNSGSISSSGDEEYDSRSDMVPPFLNHHPPFGSFSLVSHHHHQTHPPPLFDLSPNYLQSLSSQTHGHLNSNPSPFLNLDTGANSHHQDPRSQPNCTAPAVPSSSAAKQPMLSTDPSLQLRSLHDDNHRVSAPPANAVRNPKKRTRASRRAPTTVLTTDTSNFRAMVQEFTGIPAPPFSGTSYSRRLDLLTASSSLRSSIAASSSHLDTTTTPPFYPLRPSPHHPNPLLLSPTSSSPSPSSTLMLHNHLSDAIASTTAGNNPSPSSMNYQNDAPASYSHPQNMLTMQILPFQTPMLHPLDNHSLHVGFSAKSQPSSSMPSLEDQLGMSHAHLMSSHHPHVSSSEAEGMPLSGGGHDFGGHAPKDQSRSFHVAAPWKLNFSGGSSSADKNLENTSARGEEVNHYGVELDAAMNHHHHVDPGAGG